MQGKDGKIVYWVTHPSLAIASKVLANAPKLMPRFAFPGEQLTLQDDTEKSPAALQRRPPIKRLRPDPAGY